MIDLGFSIFYKIRIRLRGVDTPEVFGANASAAGRAASDYVRNLIEGRSVTVRTYKNPPNTFNRWEADVIINEVLIEMAGVSNLADHLVAIGHAKRV
jgi:endonuclease YncB( thermonuclease family)